MCLEESGRPNNTNAYIIIVKRQGECAAGIAGILLFFAYKQTRKKLALCWLLPTRGRETFAKDAHPKKRQQGTRLEPTNKQPHAKR